ncbi:ricin-type beta-trefoil lectin domain protein [Streptomyces sp. NPDC048685]|uniref:ricin-type beta-trefoil lectin domain protein n=1 Tax=Streptomyces sp. NPDC048685 TaxID=3365584 RepID=UPI00371989B9
MPGDQNDHKGNADGKPDQTSTHKPSTGGSASPGRSPHTSVTATPHQTAGGSTASGGSTGGGSSNGGGAGTDPTKGAASGSGDAGGSHGSNGSSGASNPATPPASSGRFRLRDVGYGKCLAVSYSVVFDTCADTPATNWTAKAGSDGSYVLYNESADQCLHVNRNLLSMADCGSSRQNWRTGTSSTVVNLDSSLCLEERSGWPVVGSCEPSKSTQHWAKE